MRINGIEIKPGEHKQTSFNIAKLPSRTEIDIPVDIFRGPEDGPCLLLMAGLHGDELNGVELIRRMMQDNSIHPNRGTVIAIPILNVYGFLNFSRDVPDGKDVNRRFPGHPKGSLASRVAYHFMQEILPFIDYGIDFHTGGASRSNYPQIRCVMGVPDNDMLAKAFAAPFILNAPLRDRSLRKEASKLGKSIIVFEAGESLRFDEFAIAEGIKGTLRVMHHLNMIDNSEPGSETKVIKKSAWVRARQAGLFRYFIKNGDAVQKGKVLASISDPYGDFEKKIKAHGDGYVIAINNLPIVNQGDAVIHLGFTDDQEFN